MAYELDFIGVSKKTDDATAIGIRWKKPDGGYTVGVFDGGTAAYGEVPVAVCVREAGSRVSEQEVRSWLSGRVARFEVPEHVVFADELPLTPASKPDRARAASIVLDHIAQERTAVHG